MKEAYERGGINTFCWHMDNPANGKSAWDTTMRTVAAIIPGGAFNDIYTAYLDKAAKYLEDLKGNEVKLFLYCSGHFMNLRAIGFGGVKILARPMNLKHCGSTPLIICVIPESCIIY